MSIALTVEAAVDKVAHAVASENATSVLTASTTVLMLANTLRASVTTTRSGKDGGPNTSVKSWRSSSNPNPSLRRPMRGVMDASDSKDE